MTIADKSRDEKRQYDINRKIAKMSKLSSGNIGKSEYLTSEEILLSTDQNRMIESVKFTYSPLDKALEKQTKTIADQGKKNKFKFWKL